MEIDFAKVARQIVEYIVPAAEAIVPLDWRPAVMPALAAIRVLIPIVFEGIASGESSDDIIKRLRGAVRAPIRLEAKTQAHLERVRKEAASDPQIMATVSILERVVATNALSSIEKQIAKDFIRAYRFENA